MTDEDAVPEYDGPSLQEIVINELAFRSLNVVPYSQPESLEEAIWGLADWIRKGSLGIALALFKIADALEDDDPPAA